MKEKILIIEDVKEMSDLISMYLTKEGMDTKQCESAEDALSLLETYSPDLVVLDLNLPGVDGFEFLKQFRKNFSVPVIIVSARDADEDIISGLSDGADEFITKPFSPKVLVARIKAIMRRSQGAAAPSDSTFSFGEYLLDYNSFTLKRIVPGAPRPERVPLSAKEYDVLVCLIAHIETPMTPEQIYAEVWKTEFGDLSAVAVYIQRLRKKIEKDPSKPQYIKTIFGMGYCFSLKEK